MLLQLEIYPAVDNPYSHGGDLVLGFYYHDHGWIRSRERKIVVWRHGKLENSAMITYYADICTRSILLSKLVLALYLRYPQPLSTLSTSKRVTMSPNNIRPGCGSASGWEVSVS